jgi:Flp pilus assembly protein TadB
MDTGLPVSLIVEATLTVLLAATLISCVVLERRLRGLRKDQERLSHAVRSLNGAIAAAQASLGGLRAAATEADETLGRKMGMARKLADELSVLAAAGERIAARMEAAHDARQRNAAPLRAAR